MIRSQGTKVNMQTLSVTSFLAGRAKTQVCDKNPFQLPSYPPRTVQAHEGPWILVLLLFQPIFYSTLFYLINYEYIIIVIVIYLLFSII